jgi:hypothetical protein
MSFAFHASKINNNVGMSGAYGESISKIFGNQDA